MPEPLQRCSACGTTGVEGALYCYACGTPMLSDTRGTPAPTRGGGGVEPSGAGERSGAGEGGPSPGTGAAAGTPDALDADEQLARALGGRFEVQTGEWMSRGWAVFTRAGGLFLGFAAIEWLFYTFAAPIFILLSPMLTSGFFVAALKLRRNERLQFSDFWLPFNDFVPLFLAWVVATSFLCLGLLTCGVVTVYLWVAYQFVYILILDRRMDFWEALEASRKASTKHWLGLFFFSSVVFLLNLVTFLATLSLGLIVTIPFTCCVMVEAYAEIFGVRGGRPGKTLPPDAGRGEAPATVLAG